jgi:hypothetical protein
VREENIAANEVTYYAFVKNGYSHFDPQHISTGTITVDWIFPVPEANAVGTLDRQSNSVVFLKFSGYGKDPICKVVAHDCGKESITGNHYYRLSPNFADDMIVYANLEEVITADVKNGRAFCAKRILSDVKIKNGEALYANGDSYKYPHEMMAVSFLNPQTTRNCGHWRPYSVLNV